MTPFGAGSPTFSVILLGPALAFAAVGLFREAVGEWGAAALIAWTALGAALFAGAALQAGDGTIAWPALALGVAAVMIGGPPGLVVASVALVPFLLPGLAPATGRGLLGLMALLPLAVALRQVLA